jgi:hypothetical protein
MNTTFSIRTFNEAGLAAFEEVLQKMKSGEVKDMPDELLFADDFSEVHSPVVNIERVSYTEKNQLVPYLVSKLDLRDNKHLYFDKGLWSWLSAFYFHNVCPIGYDGKRKVNELAYYVLRDPKNYTKFYRHLLAYPSRVYAELDESSRIFLVGTFAKRGEITEQFGAYQEIALNKPIIDAANLLYWDTSLSNIKRGAASKSGGSARRLVRVIRQYQLTYDLNSMKGNDIVNMLPPEFNKWQ